MSRKRHLHCVPKNVHLFYFWNNSLKKLIDFNDFGVCPILSRFDINSLYICPPHLYTVATLPWEIQKKLFFNRIIHTYFRLLTLSQKKTNCHSLTHHPWRMLPPYLVKCTDFYLFNFFTCIKYQHTFNPLYRRAAEASCCDRNSVEFQHSVVDDAVDQWKKDWKHVSLQKMVTLNICCNIACLTFHLPHVTTVFLEPPMPTHNRLFSEPSMFGGMQHTFTQMKSCAFYKVVQRHFSGVVGKG